MNLGATELLDHLESDKKLVLNIGNTEAQITRDDVEIEQQAKDDYVEGDSGQDRLFLKIALSPELKEEGFIRDVVRRIQSMRKDLDLDYAQQIEVYIDSDEFATNAIIAHQEYIEQETLATKLNQGQTDKGSTKHWEVDDHKLVIGLIPVE